MKVLVLASTIVMMTILVPVNGMAANSSIEDVPKITQQQSDLRQKVLAGKGAFKDIDASSRTTLLGKQDIVMGLLDGKQSTTQLSPADQVTLVNTLGEIAVIVDKAEDERMVCRREKKTGSNRPETICKTVAQLRDEREEADKYLTSPRNASCMTQCGETMGAEGW